ncbi:MAG: cyclic pyranopterin monophosphate synthase MoaC [Caulobacteraceae bacterium]
MSQLSHLSPDGRPRMVDVSQKPPTVRRARAEGMVKMTASTRQLALSGGGKKGEVARIAEIAGIIAAKKTSELIPLCHPLPLSSVTVEVSEAEGGIRVEAGAATTGPTGVEMEALTAVTIACLTIYDMLKSAERGMVIEGVRLLSKEGGSSGEWRAG